MTGTTIATEELLLPISSDTDTCSKVLEEVTLIPKPEELVTTYFSSFTDDC